jgi:hypothetical protein
MNLQNLDASWRCQAVHWNASIGPRTKHNGE